MTSPLTHSGDDTMSEIPEDTVILKETILTHFTDYLVWSNEHKSWWGANRRGYVSEIEDAGRYSRGEALQICIGARGGRQFNENPTEVPIPYEDAILFWPDDKPEWRKERRELRDRFSYEDEEA